jgi:hypothetical protein
MNTLTIFGGKEKHPDIVQHNPTASMQKLSEHLSVSQTCVWQSLHDDSL